METTELPNPTTAAPRSHLHHVHNKDVGSIPTFAIADLTTSAMSDDKMYREEIKATHEQLLNGKVDTYYEAQISLPRSLQGLRTATTIAKLSECNPQLRMADWSQVTVDVVGNNMFMTTFNEQGRTLLRQLKELKTLDGKKMVVPEPKRPCNKYYVDILMNREWETHADLLAEALVLFRSAETIENPNYNKPLGSKRLFRITFNSMTAPRAVFTLEDENVPIREIKTPNGATAQVIHKWSRLNAFPPPSLAKTWQPKRSYAKATTGHTDLSTAEAPHRNASQAQPKPPRETTIKADKQRMVGPVPKEAEIGHNSESMEKVTSATPTSSNVLTTESERTENRTSDKTNEKTDEEWTLVERTTKMRNPEPPKPSIMGESPSNRFEALSVVEIDKFEKNVFTPIAITSPTEDYRKFYKSKRYQKTTSALQTQAMAHPQEIRHPSIILKTVSPARGQYLISAKYANMEQYRAKLRDQIAFLRAARTGYKLTSGPALASLNDQLFIMDCQQMLTEKNMQHTLHSTSDISTFITAMTDGNKERLKWARRLGWVDLLTRFYLPHLYSSNERPESWYGVPLRWIPSAPEEQLMLKDESLHALVKCKALAPLWNIVADMSPDHADALNQVNTIATATSPEHKTNGTQADSTPNSPL